MSLITLMAQLGAHLKNLRMLHVVREQARLASGASNMRRLMLTNSGDPAYSTSDTEEAAAYVQDGSHLDDVLVPALQDSFIAYRDGLAEVTSWFGVVASELSLDIDDLGDPIEYDHSDVAGEIRISKRGGPLGALYDALLAAGYVVVASKITAGSLVPKATNSGELETTQVGVDRFFPNCPSGKLVLICTDPAISAPKFSVKHIFDGTAILADGTPSLEGEFELQAEQPYTDGSIGLNGVVFSRPGLAAPEEFNDDADLFSGFSVESPHEDDCDEGKFYLSVYRDLTKWYLYVHRAAARGGSDLVGQLYPDIDTGTEALSITCSNGSVINFTFDHDAALVEFPDTQTGEELDAYIDIGTLAEGDEFSITLSNSGAGNFSTKLKHAWRAHLPSGPAKPSTAPVDALAGAGAGSVDNGDYVYAVSFVSLLGESGVGAESGGVTVVDNSTNGKVALSSIPLGPSGTTARKIYRRTSDPDTLKLLTTISDNVTTTYQDNATQASLSGNAAPLTEIDEDYAASEQLD